MQYDFDKIIDRHNTFSWKWDGLAQNSNAIPLMLADMDLPSPQPVIEAMHRVADFQMYGYTNETLDPDFAVLSAVGLKKTIVGISCRKKPCFPWAPSAHWSTA